MEYRAGFFTNRRGTRLFIAEDLPNSPTDAAWLLCSPILEEKNVAHGALVTLGRALASLGVRAARVDYEGHGDSAGDTAGLGLADWTDDVCDAAARLTSDGVRRLTILGCRAGALIAARAAAHTGAECVVAWCPVLRGDDHVQDLLRLNLTTQLAVFKKVQQDREAMVAALNAGEIINIVGWDMGQRLLSSLMGASLADAIARLQCPVEILDLVRTEAAAVSPPVAALASPSRVVVRGVAGLQFWIDSNFIDYQQARLVGATTALLGRLRA